VKEEVRIVEREEVAVKENDQVKAFDTLSE